MPRPALLLSPRAVKTLLICLASLWCTVPAVAQDGPDATPRRLTLSANLDVVNRYYWRYVLQDDADPGPHLQPSITLGLGGFEATAWASTRLGGDFRELDLALGYRLGSFGVGYNHYLLDRFGGEEGYGEVIASYEGGERLPLRLLVGVFVYGDKDRSTYVEAAYDLPLGAQTLSLIAGTSPRRGFYTEDGTAGLVQLGVKASREFVVSARTLSPFAGYSYNPDAGRGQVLFGLSLY